MADISNPRPKATWAAWIQIVITSAGFLGLVWQFREYNEASEREERRRSDEAVSRLYATEIDIRKFLSGYPEIREYLADDPEGAKFEKLRAEKKDATVSRVRLACGMYANFFEYYLLIEKNLHRSDKDSIQRAFRKEIETILDNSGALRFHLNEHRDTWTAKLMEIRDAAEARRTKK